MTTKNIWKGTAKRFTACLVFLCLWVMVPGAWAAYEASGVTSTPFVAPMTTYSKCTENITVSWTAPSMGTDILNSYFYQWNNSSLSLNAEDTLITSFSTAGFSTLDQSVNPPNVVKAAADLAALDSGSALYLHIVTSYLADGGTPRVSADVVYGPFLIDNKAPTGTVRIVDANGNDITSTIDTIVKVKLGSSTDTTRVYLNEASAILTSLQLAYSTDAEYPFADTTPGSKTIYAWFEDSVGNISATPVTDSVTLLAPISISPDTATLPAAGTPRAFRVEGTSATYNWTIINEKDETGAAATAGTIAEFSGSGSAVNSVTVQGKVTGSFQLQAVPTSGAGTLTSGTITVAQTSVSKTFSLQTTAKTNVNAIGFVLENTGITTAHELGLAVGNCDLVSRWDEATQKYSSHPMASAGYNNFPLVVGKAYFVSVTAAHDFTLTGSLPESKTVTLVTTAKTNVNAIGIPKTKEALTTAHQLGLNIGNVDLVSRWDVATQKYSSHPMASAGYNNFAIEWGYGYFVSVTQNNTQWDW